MSWVSLGQIFSIPVSNPCKIYVFSRLPRNGESHGPRHPTTASAAATVTESKPVLSADGHATNGDTEHAETDAEPHPNP